MAANAHTPAIRATMALFVLQPLVLGGWFALIPHVQRTLELSKSELALALLGAPISLMIALQFAGRAVAKFGARRVFLLTFPVQGAAVMLPLWATSQTTLFLSLMALGGAVAMMEVCLNSYAGRLEIESERLIMNRCHGFWSMGIGLGSLVVTTISPHFGPVASLASVAAFSVVLGVMTTRSLPNLSRTETQAKARRRRGFRDIPVGVLLVSVLLMPVTMTEGAMADWAAIYLSERIPEATSYAGVAVTIFAGSLTLGRFSGDALKYRFGATVLARATLTLAISGLILLALPLPNQFAYVGFILIGLGVSVAFPLGISATAAQGGDYEAENIAIMTTFAMVGFLAGPPLIGFLADYASLRVGLAALIPMLVISLLLTRILTPGRD